jgi:hypothetical protein
MLADAFFVASLPLSMGPSRLAGGAADTIN